VPETVNWKEYRERKREFLDEEPAVLIIGRYSTFFVEVPSSRRFGSKSFRSFFATWLKSRRALMEDLKLSFIVN
jgi:hypothetical protein